MVVFESRQSLASFEKQVKVDVVVDIAKKRLRFYFNGAIDSEIDLSTQNGIDFTSVLELDSKSPFQIGTNESSSTSINFQGKLGKMTFYNTPHSASAISSQLDNRLLLGYNFDQYKNNGRYDSFVSVSEYPLDLVGSGKQELIASYLKWNKALSFSDTTTASINLNGSSINFSKFAYTSWLKLDSSTQLSNDRVIVYKSNCFHISLNSQNQLYFYNMSNGGETLLFDEDTLSNDVWVHICVCVEEDQSVTFYKNGVQIGTRTLTNVLNASTVHSGNLHIGYDGNSFTFGKGAMDDIYIFEELVVNDYRNSVEDLYRNLLHSNNYSTHKLSYPKLGKNAWYHVAATYDSREKVLKTYHNGELVNIYSNYVVPSDFNNNVIYMGREENLHYYQGMIDDVRVYDQALQPSDIKKIYDEFFLAGNLGSNLLNSSVFDSVNFTLSITSATFSNSVVNVQFEVGSEIDDWYVVAFTDHPDTLSYRTVVDEYITGTRYTNAVYSDSSVGTKHLLIQNIIATVHSPFERREIISSQLITSCTVYVYGKKTINGTVYEIMRSHRIDSSEVEPYVQIKSPVQYVRGYVNFGSLYAFSSQHPLESVYIIPSIRKLIKTPLSALENTNPLIHFDFSNIAEGSFSSIPNLAPSGGSITGTGTVYTDANNMKYMIQSGAVGNTDNSTFPFTGALTIAIVFKSDGNSYKVIHSSTNNLEYDFNSTFIAHGHPIISTGDISNLLQNSEYGVFIHSYTDGNEQNGKAFIKFKMNDGSIEQVFPTFGTFADPYGSGFYLHEANRHPVYEFVYIQSELSDEAINSLGDYLVDKYFYSGTITNLQGVSDFETLYNAHPTHVTKYLTSTPPHELFSHKDLLFDSVYDGTTFTTLNEEDVSLSDYYLYAMAKDQLGNVTITSSTNYISFDRFAISEEIHWDNLQLLPGPASPVGTPHLTQANGGGVLQFVSTTTYGEYVIASGPLGANAGKAFIYKRNADTEVYEMISDVSSDSSLLSGEYTVTCNYGMSNSISADGKYVVVSGHSSSAINTGSVFIFKRNETANGYELYQNLSTDQLVEGVLPSTDGGYYGMHSSLSPDGNFLTVSGYGSTVTTGICLVFKRASGNGMFEFMQDLSVEISARLHCQTPMSADGKTLVLCTSHSPNTNNDYATFKFYRLNDTESMYELSQTLHFERGGSAPTYNNIYSIITQLNISHNGHVVLATGNRNGYATQGAQLLFMKNKEGDLFYLHSDFRRDNGSVMLDSYTFCEFGSASALSSDGKHVVIGGYGTNNENLLYFFSLDEKTNVYYQGKRYQSSSLFITGVAMSGTGTYVVAMRSDNMYVFKGDNNIQFADVSFTAPTETHGLIVNSWTFRSSVKRIIRYYIFAMNHTTTVYSRLQMIAFVTSYLDNSNALYTSDTVQERSVGGAQFYFYNSMAIEANSTHTVDTPIEFTRAFSVNNSSTSWMALGESSDPVVYIGMIAEDGKVYVNRATELASEMNTTLPTPIGSLPSKNLDWNWSSTNTDYLVRGTTYSNGPTGLPHMALQMNANGYGSFISSTYYGDRIVVTSSHNRNSASSFTVYKNDGHDNYLPYSVLGGAPEMYKFALTKAWITSDGEFVCVGGRSPNLSLPEKGGVFVWKHNAETHTYDFHQMISLADIQANVPNFNERFAQYVTFSKDGNYICMNNDETTAPYPANPDAGGWTYKRNMFIFKRNAVTDVYEFYQDATEYVDRTVEGYPSDGYFLLECPITSDCLILSYSHHWSNPSPNTFSKFYARFRTFVNLNGSYTPTHTNNATEYIDSGINGKVTVVSLSNDGLTLVASGPSFSNYNGVAMMMKRDSVTTPLFRLIDTAQSGGTLSTGYTLQTNTFGDTNSLSADGKYVVIGGDGNNQDIVKVMTYSSLDPNGTIVKYLSTKQFNNTDTGRVEPYEVEMSGDGMYIFTTGQNRSLYIYKTKLIPYYNPEFTYTVDEATGHVTVNTLKFDTIPYGPRIHRYYVLALVEPDQYNTNTIKTNTINTQLDGPVKNGSFATTSVSTSGIDNPVVIAVTDGVSSDLQPVLSEPSIKLLETNGASVVSSAVTKSISNILHSVIQLKEWSRTAEITDNHFTLTVSSNFCTIIGGYLPEDGASNLSNLFINWFGVSSESFTYHNGYGILDVDDGAEQKGPLNWISVVVPPGTYKTPSSTYTVDLVTPHTTGDLSTTLSINFSSKLYTDDGGTSGAIANLYDDDITTFGLQKGVAWSSLTAEDEVLVTFSENKLVSKFAIADARRDWSFTAFDVYTGVDVNNLTKVGTYSFTPTTNADTGESNIETYTFSTPITCKYMSFKNFVGWRTDGPLDVCGINQIKVWGANVLTNSVLTPHSDGDSSTVVSVNFTLSNPAYLARIYDNNYSTFNLDSGFVWSTSPTDEILYTFATTNLVTQFAIADARSDFSFFGYDVYVGTERDNMTLLGTFAHTPTKQWNQNLGNGLANYITHVLSTPVIAKYVGFRNFQGAGNGGPTNADHTASGSAGVSEIKIWGVKGYDPNVVLPTFNYDWTVIGVGHKPNAYPTGVFLPYNNSTNGGQFYSYSTSLIPNGIQYTAPSFTLTRAFTNNNSTSGTALTKTHDPRVFVALIDEDNIVNVHLATRTYTNEVVFDNANIDHRADIASLDWRYPQIVKGELVSSGFPSFIPELPETYTKLVPNYFGNILVCVSNANSEHGVLVYKWANNIEGKFRLYSILEGGNKSAYSLSNWIKMSSDAQYIAMVGNGNNTRKGGAIFIYKHDEVHQKYVFHQEYNTTQLVQNTLDSGLTLTNGVFNDYFSSYMGASRDGKYYAVVRSEGRHNNRCYVFRRNENSGMIEFYQDLSDQIPKEQAKLVEISNDGETLVVLNYYFSVVHEGPVDVQLRLYIFKRNHELDQFELFQHLYHYRTNSSSVMAPQSNIDQLHVSADGKLIMWSGRVRWMYSYQDTTGATLYRYDEHTNEYVLDNQIGDRGSIPNIGYGYVTGHGGIDEYYASYTGMSDDGEVIGVFSQGGWNAHNQIYNMNNHVLVGSGWKKGHYINQWGFGNRFYNSNTGIDDPYKDIFREGTVSGNGKYMFIVKGTNRIYIFKGGEPVSNPLLTYTVDESTGFVTVKDVSFQTTTNKKVIRYYALVVRHTVAGAFLSEVTIRDTLRDYIDNAVRNNTTTYTTGVNQPYNNSSGADFYIYSGPEIAADTQYSATNINAVLTSQFSYWNTTTGVALNLSTVPRVYLGVVDEDNNITVVFGKEYIPDTISKEEPEIIPYVTADLGDYAWESGYYEGLVGDRYTQMIGYYSSFSISHEVHTKFPNNVRPSYSGKYLLVGNTTAFSSCPYVLKWNGKSASYDLYSFLHGKADTADLGTGQVSFTSDAKYVAYIVNNYSIWKGGQIFIYKHDVVNKKYILDQHITAEDLVTSAGDEVPGFTFSLNNDNQKVFTKYLGNMFIMSRTGDHMAFLYSYREGSTWFMHIYKRNQVSQLMEYFQTVDMHGIIPTSVPVGGHQYYIFAEPAISNDGSYIFVCASYQNFSPRYKFFMLLVYQLNTQTNRYEIFQVIDLQKGNLNNYQWAPGYVTHVDCSADGQWVLCTSYISWEDPNASLLFRFSESENQFYLHSNFSYTGIAGGTITGVAYNYNQTSSNYGRFSSMSDDAKYIVISGDVWNNDNKTIIFKRDDTTNLYTVATSFAQPNNTTNTSMLHSCVLTGNGEQLFIEKQGEVFAFKNVSSPSNIELTYFVDPATGYVTLKDVSFKTPADVKIARYYVLVVRHTSAGNFLSEVTIRDTIRDYIDNAVRNNTTSYTTGVNKPYNNATSGADFYIYSGPEIDANTEYSATDINAILPSQFSFWNTTTGVALNTATEPRVYLGVVDQNNNITVVFGKEFTSQEINEPISIPYTSKTNLDWKDKRFPELFVGDRFTHGKPHIQISNINTIYGLSSSYSGVYIVLSGQNQVAHEPVVYKLNENNVYELYSVLVGHISYDVNFPTYMNTYITSDGQYICLSGYGASSTTKGGKVFIFKNNIVDNKFELQQTISHVDVSASAPGQFTYNPDTQVCNRYFGKHSKFSRDGQYLSVADTLAYNDNTLVVYKKNSVSGMLDFYQDLSPYMKSHLIKSNAPISNNGRYLVAVTGWDNYNNNNHQFIFKLHTFKNNTSSQQYELIQTMELRRNLNENYNGINAMDGSLILDMSADGKWLAICNAGYWTGREGTHLLFAMNEATEKYELHTNLGKTNDTGALIGVSYTTSTDYFGRGGMSMSDDGKYIQIAGNRGDSSNRCIIYERDDSTQMYSVKNSYSNVSSENWAVNWMTMSGDASKFFVMRTNSYLFVVNGTESPYNNIELEYSIDDNTGAVVIDNLSFTPVSTNISRYYIVALTEANRHEESLIRDTFIANHIDNPVKNGTTSYSSDAVHLPYNNNSTGGEFYFYEGPIAIESGVHQRTFTANIRLTRSFTSYNATNGTELNTSHVPRVFVALVDENNNIFVKRGTLSPIELPPESATHTTADIVDNDSGVITSIDWTTTPTLIPGQERTDGLSHINFTAGLDNIACSSSGQYVIAYNANWSPAISTGAVVLKHQGNDQFIPYSFLNGGVERVSLSNYSKPSISADGQFIVISGYGRSMDTKASTVEYGAAFIYNRNDTTHTYDLVQTIKEGPFTYTFEIVIPSAKHDNSSVETDLTHAVRAIKVNGFYASEWSEFVSVNAVSALATGSPSIDELTKDTNLYPSWNWTADNQVGRVLFEIVTSEKVKEFVIESFTADTSPGWKILENGVAVFTDTVNKGSDTVEFVNNYTYSVTTTPFYNFGQNCALSPDGSTLIIGGSKTNGNGIVKVYKKGQDGFYTFYQDITSDVVDASMVTGGYGMSLDGTYLTVGRYVQTNSNTGGAVVLKNNGSQYTTVATILETTSGGALGQHVKMSHDGSILLLSGTYVNNFSSARVYRNVSDSYLHVQNLRDGVTLANNTYYGIYSSMTSDGRYIVITGQHNQQTIAIFKLNDSSGKYDLVKQLSSFNGINPRAAVITNSGKYIFMVNDDGSGNFYVLKSNTYNFSYT
jgi:hypothetical protein